MTTTVRVYDPFNGNMVAWEDVFTEADICYGIQSGEIGAMCGGCPACLMMQADRSGFYVVTCEDEETWDDWCAGAI